MIKGLLILAHYQIRKLWLIIYWTWEIYFKLQTEYGKSELKNILKQLIKQ